VGVDVDHDLEAPVVLLQRAHRLQQQLDDRGVDECALAEVDQQIATGGGDVECVRYRPPARDIVIAAESDDGGAVRDDLDGDGSRRRAAAVE
jgi:hypothetical protein